MAYHPQRLGALVARRPIAALALATSIVHGGGLLWEARPAANRAPEAEAVRTYAVRSEPFVATVSVVGTIAPGDSADVVTPFDGVVRLTNIDYGRAVEAGQVLLVMDSFELEQQRREAETSYLKAEEADADMAAWSTGPEMSHARRTVTSAELALQATRRKTTGTKSLFDRGLVARDEYDALVQQEKTETMALAAANEDLATIQKKGEGPSRRVSAIALQNAGARLADLTTQLSGATVSAPAAGIIVRPPAAKGEQGEGPIHAGQHLTRGQLIGTIAKPEGLDVSFKLDEADANRVREGQTAIVTGPGFFGLTLSGQVTRVAGEGTVGDPGLQGSLFAATVRLAALDLEQARVVRIGMSANVTITLYQASSATTVPPEALQGTPTTATVMVQDARSGRAEVRKITIGAVAPDAVEILSGLSAGDVVIWKDVAGQPVRVP
jgi:HlyD family secretion protein